MGESMSKKPSVKEVLSQFCEEWNKRDLSLKLYPVFMVPENFAVEVAKAQIDLEVERSVELPDDVQDAEGFLEWARSFEENSQGLFVTPLQVAAVDGKNRVAVLDVEVSVGDKGLMDGLTQIIIETVLTGYSRRKTWLFPNMLPQYDKWIESGKTSHLGDHAEERIVLFRNAVRSMIRAKIKDVKERVLREQSAEKDRKLMQAMIDEVKSLGVSLKDLSDDGFIEVEQESYGGYIRFKKGQITCDLFAESTSVERKAFADLIKKLMD